MKPHCFGRTTGKDQVRECPTCGVRVRHVQLVYRTASAVGELWLADFHTAPCGGVCVIGEADPHGGTPKKIHVRRDCSACARLAAGVQTSRLAGAH